MENSAQKEIEVFANEVGRGTKEYARRCLRWYLVALVFLFVVEMAVVAYVLAPLYDGIECDKKATRGKIIPEVTVTSACPLPIDMTREKVVKVGQDARYTYIYKTYHNHGMLVYVTIGYPKNKNGEK